MGATLNTGQVRDRLGLLSDLGCGFAESGQPEWRTRTDLEIAAKKLGLKGFGFTMIGRMTIAEAQATDGNNLTVSAAANGLDLIDCTRSLNLHRLVTSLHRDGVSDSTLPKVRDQVNQLRATVTPWWAVAMGTTLLAFVISMQLGVGWKAWVTASAVQLITACVGRLVRPLKLPYLFQVALLACVAGTIATLLVKAGAVDPVGAAAAIAVNWLLLIPLPQLVGALSDVVDGDYLTAVSRAGAVVVTGIGIAIAATYIFTLGELLHMEHPLIADLPGLSWYFALVFSALGAIGNALANGGNFRLLLPAAFIGILTGGVNQLLLVGFGIQLLWANAIAAVVLGAVTVVLAHRTGYPQHVFALMGITGALLPGIAVVSGILRQMGGQSGAQQFANAMIICIALAIGVAFGAYVAERIRGVSRARRHSH